MNMNKMVVIEGLDSLGKETQANLFQQEGWYKVSFPNYESETSAVVKMYLAGELGNDPYLASTSFLLDQAATLKKFPLPDEKNVVFDRFWTSNALYQSTKLEGDARKDFLAWHDLMVHRLGLDIFPSKNVMFLWLPEERWLELLQKRGSSKHEGGDIHEGNLDFLKGVYQKSLAVAQEHGWTIVDCSSPHGDMLPREEIHKKISGLL